MRERYTAQSYCGYWWVCDNETGEAVTSSNGRRLFYHINTLGMQEARDRAFRKAETMNAEGAK